MSPLDCVAERKIPATGKVTSPSTATAPQQRTIALAPRGAVLLKSDCTKDTERPRQVGQVGLVGAKHFVADRRDVRVQRDARDAGILERLIRKVFL